jgi:hypothetical protein
MPGGADAHGIGLDTHVGSVGIESALDAPVDNLRERLFDLVSGPRPGQEALTAGSGGHPAVDDGASWRPNRRRR